MSNAHTVFGTTLSPTPHSARLFVWHQSSDKIHQDERPIEGDEIADGFFLFGGSVVEHVVANVTKCIEQFFLFVVIGVVIFLRGDVLDEGAETFDTQFVLS